MRRCVGNHAVFVLQFSADGRLSEILPWDGETPDERMCLARSIGAVRFEPPPGRETHVRFDLAPNGTSGDEAPAD